MDERTEARAAGRAARAPLSDLRPLYLGRRAISWSSASSTANGSAGRGAAERIRVRRRSRRLQHHPARRSTSWRPSASWCAARARAPSSPATTKRAFRFSSSSSSPTAAPASSRKAVFSASKRQAPMPPRPRPWACARAPASCASSGSASSAGRSALPSASCCRAACSRASKWVPPNNLDGLRLRFRRHHRARRGEAQSGRRRKREARQLKLAPGAPLLSIDRRAIAADGKPAEWRVSLCRTDRSHYASDSGERQGPRVCATEVELSPSTLRFLKRYELELQSR